MRRLILLFVIIISFNNVTAQCTPDPIFTMSPVPGVYPPNIPIPGVAFFGISDGNQGSNYNQTLTLVVLEDTTLDIASFLPTAVVNGMNLAGIPTMMTVDVNHVSFDITGLPSNLVYDCDISTCQYPSSVDGCIQISGIPLQSGTFPIDVNMTINIQIPPITTLFSGMAVDIPAFSAVGYDLLINGSTAISDYQGSDFVLFPNPTTNSTTLKSLEIADIKIYNVLGKLVKEYASINAVKVSKSDIGTGMFYVSVTTNKKREIIKLIIK